jgi:3-hydroxyisobutyrate dehydrogenase
MTEVREADGRQIERLGYLGLGVMGFPMTRRLLNAGYEVAVWNRSAGKAAALVEAGAKLAANPREMVTTATIIFMCVTDAAAVEKVVFGPDGLAATPGDGKLVVDFSSIHPTKRARSPRASRLQTAWDGSMRPSRAAPKGRRKERLP